MKEVFSRLNVLLVILLSIQLVLAGCATKGKNETLEMPVSPIEKSSSSSESKSVTLESPETYGRSPIIDCSGALKGAGCGMVAGASYGLIFDLGTGAILFGPVFTVTGAILGAGVGAVSGSFKSN